MIQRESVVIKTVAVLAAVQLYDVHAMIVALGKSHNPLIQKLQKEQLETWNPRSHLFSRRLVTKDRHTVQNRKQGLHQLQLQNSSFRRHPRHCHGRRRWSQSVLLQSPQAQFSPVLNKLRPRPHPHHPFPDLGVINRQNLQLKILKGSHQVMTQSLTVVAPRQLQSLCPKRARLPHQDQSWKLQACKVAFALAYHKLQFVYKLLYCRYKGN